MSDAERRSYEEALKEVAHRRMKGMTVLLDHKKPPHPESPLNPITQIKVVMTNTLMSLNGRTPGDMPIDQSINYQYLKKESLDFLSTKLGIPANRDFAPFAADYTLIFGGGDRLFTTENAELFYGQLIHILVVEAQLVLTQQYFYGLGLYKKISP